MIPHLPRTGIGGSYCRIIREWFTSSINIQNILGQLTCFLILNTRPTWNPRLLNIQDSNSSDNPSFRLVCISDWWIHRTIPQVTQSNSTLGQRETHGSRKSWGFFGEIPGQIGFPRTGPQVKLENLLVRWPKRYPIPGMKKQPWFLVFIVITRGKRIVSNNPEAYGNLISSLKYP